MPEQVLIIAVKRPSKTNERFQSSIDELIRLVQTAGGMVSEVYTQKRDQFHGAHYIGKGKMMELIPIINEQEIDLVVANDELSTSQIRNLSTRFGIPVIDRSQLILDIFAMRAQTKEGKLQVELAQLEYLLPRLHGQGHFLSRLGGGIGTRGPGETKLETDKRHIRRRIVDIKARLSKVVEQRAQYRKRRRENDVLQIALVGYTNAGKSTLFNQISNSRTLEEDKLFATLDPLTRKVQLPSGLDALLTDTVGFIEDLPTTLIAAFKSTLEEVTEADFILHVVDASSPDRINQQETVHRLLRDLKADTIPMLMVYNKKDKLIDTFIPDEYPAIQISAKNDRDGYDVLAKIEEILRDNWTWYRATITANQGKLLSRVERETIMEKQYFDEAQMNYNVQGFVKKGHPLEDLLKEQEEAND